jgi:2-desacetyl-2-hydroxyethyl bacteriochlorophyllide A dehydrogenase
VTVRFTGPGRVDLAPYAPDELLPGQVRVRTLYSGISAGTELTAYRGSSPYLRKQWDADQRVFRGGGQSFAYPIGGWGYSEVGEVVEVAATDRRADAAAHTLATGDVVWGIWGHRSEAVLGAADVVGRMLPPGMDPLHGVFGRVGAVALNAIVAADIHVGEVVAVFGQGVLGLLATRLACLNGGRVVAVDSLLPRLDLARRFGARHALAAGADGVAEAIKGWSPAGGADVAIEISGSYAGLHEAVRCVAVGGRVVAAGFYQGEGVGLALGEEFHHNRVQIIASQIGGPAEHVRGRWTVERMQQTFMHLVADGDVDVAALVSHVVPVGQVQEAFALLDQRPQEALQVVLDFTGADPERDAA